MGGNHRLQLFGRGGGYLPHWQVDQSPGAFGCPPLRVTDSAHCAKEAPGVYTGILYPSDAHVPHYYVLFEGHAPDIGWLAASS
jgi:hypothetical protein